MTFAPARFRQPLFRAGWQIGPDSPLSEHGGPNASRLHIKRGRLERRLFICAWSITSEASGRKKAGARTRGPRLACPDHPSPRGGPPRATGQPRGSLGRFQQLGVCRLPSTCGSSGRPAASPARFSEAPLHEAAEAVWAEQMRPTAQDRGELLTLGCAVAFAVHIVLLADLAPRTAPSGSPPCNCSSSAPCKA